MAKHIGKNSTVSTVEAWSSEMKKSYPVAYTAFEKMLNVEKYGSAGHMFGQLTKASEVLTVFILECGSTPPTDFKNIEEVKSSLKVAFEKAEELQAWKAVMKERYPSAFASFVRMCKHNGYATIERALASLQQITALLVIWLGNCNVSMLEDSVADTDIKYAIERALSYSEQLSHDLAL